MPVQQTHSLAVPKQVYVKPSVIGWFVSGEPPPSVLWYQDSTLIDKTFIANEKGAVQNTFTIQRYDYN
jgi:hypothetical protein